MELDMVACCFCVLTVANHSQHQPAEQRLSCSVHSAQVPESFCWQNIIDNYDCEEDNTILDCV